MDFTNRDIRISIRLSRLEDKKLKKLAKSAGMTISQYIRSRINNARLK